MLYVASFVLFLLLLNQFAAETNRVLPYKTWLFGRGYDHYGF
ncbi:putative polysaccharide biosynthesis domain protein [Bacteroides fragilis str. S36L12]|nr:putative polysaccharide biosynthesis domain protein [Bacteroides fragilis str. S36L11]EYA87416.1 putative polysaccharide biosynthesis domain protein [Bacteroides fragilis str. S36L12]